MVKEPPGPGHRHCFGLDLIARRLEDVPNLAPSRLVCRVMPHPALPALERYRPLIEDWAAFAESLAAPLPGCVWANRLRIAPARFGELLRAEGLKPESLAWHPGAFRLATEVKPGNHWWYLAGLGHSQEEASQLPVALLDPQPGERVLDLCAAPGGKSAQIVQAMENRGTLVANDASVGRVRALRANLERLGAKALNIYDLSSSGKGYCGSRLITCGKENQRKCHEDKKQVLHLLLLLDLFCIKDPLKTISNITTIVAAKPCFSHGPYLVKKVSLLSITMQSTNQPATPWRSMASFGRSPFIKLSCIPPRGLIRQLIPVFTLLKILTRFSTALNTEIAVRWLSSTLGRTFPSL